MANNDKQKENNSGIIPAALLDLMSELVNKYIERCELWQGQPQKIEQLTNLNESIKNIESQIFAFDYQPLNYTLNQLKFSEVERRLFILIFVLKTENSLMKKANEKVEKIIKSSRNNLTANTLLSILFESYSDRIINRKLFSTESSIIKNNIITMESNAYENMPNWEIEMNTRFMNYILGDNNLYATTDFLSIEESRVSFDSVIIEDAIKKDIIDALDNYDEYQKRISVLKENGVFEYGIGYTFMFYGQSGVGKTMLAHAIAKYLNKKIITYKSNKNSDNVPFRRHRNIEEQLPRLFLEVALHNGILFFDECSELFKKETQESRELLIQLEKSNVIVIFATNNLVDLSPALERRILFKYKIKAPDLNNRIKLWNHFLTKSGITGVKKELIEKISARYNMPGGFIKNAALKYINSKISGVINGAELEKITEIYYNRYIESSFVLKQSDPSAFDEKHFESINAEIKNSLDKIVEAARMLYSIENINNCNMPSINVVIATAGEHSANRLSEYIINKLQRSFIKFGLNYKSDEEFESDYKKKFIISYLQADALEDIRDTRPVIVFDQLKKNNDKYNVREEYAECLKKMTQNVGILRIMLISHKTDKDLFDDFNPDFFVRFRDDIKPADTIDKLLKHNNIQIDSALKTQIIDDCNNPKQMLKFKKIVQLYKLQNHQKEPRKFNDYIDMMFFKELAFDAPLFG
ncbi:ATP-binding protein [Candidatus Dependentiae bacterium]|nr:ATP-binding protein [Candidatus Dependentiae bacterium]